MLSFHEENFMNTHVAIDLAKLETSASKTPVRDYIHELAAQNRLRCAPTKFDELADEITSHAGDDISLDETECLIIELQRAALISGTDATKLHARYLWERDV